MGPYSRWVHPSFKQALLDHCDEWLDSTDRGNDKTRSTLITRVSKEITDIAQANNAPLPSDLEKCVRNWFGNYASGNAKEDRPGKSKSDTRGHPTSSKAWTAKSACGHIFADRISDEQKALSDGGEKDIGKYRAALANVFEQLSAEELKQCEDRAVEWNKQCLPDEVQRKLSKTIPADVTDFLKFMNYRTGAVFIAFAAYTNEDGAQTYARYETDGLNFFAKNKEHRKGQNNITDMWKEFNLANTEEEDSHEALEFDDEQYPQLPENVLELRLNRRKGILRQFMAAVRRFYELTGRIPWTDIAENPSHHLSKRSQPYSDYKLEEPSHMKSDGVDAWLEHWLKLQKKNKHPLVLKNPSDKPSDHHAPQIVSKGKGKKKAKAKDIDSDDHDDGEMDDHVNDDGVSNPAAPPSAPIHAGTNEEGNDHVKSLPMSPKGAARNRNTRRTFLTSLSDDENYKKLLLLLQVADDGELMEGAPPAWVSWKSADPYISKAFFTPDSSSSLSAFVHWIGMDPITTDNNDLASYKQVELVTLGFGLAFRALWVMQFPEKYSDVPTYILNSRYRFSQYEQLSHNIHDLLAGYAETIEEIEAYHAHNTQSSIEGTSKDVVGETEAASVKDAAVGQTDTAIGKQVTSVSNNVATGENEGDNNMKSMGRKRSDGQGTKRLHGLSGVPTALQHLREEVGLAGADWDSLGDDWRTLAALWLRAETSLSKSGRTDLSFDQIRLSSIPDAWKDWMCAKVMKTDATRPAEEFGQVFTKYLNELPSSTMAIKGTVMTEVWCRPGKTGIIGLLLCLYWQAEYSGAGNDWKANSKRVEYIFNAILAEPELQRAKRSRGASNEAGPSKRTRS